MNNVQYKLLAYHHPPTPSIHPLTIRTYPFHYGWIGTCPMMLSFDGVGLYGHTYSNSPEQAMSMIVTEAMKRLPSVLYLPSIDNLWAHASESLRSMILSCLEVCHWMGWAVYRGVCVCIHTHTSWHKWMVCLMPKYIHILFHMGAYIYVRIVIIKVMCVITHDHVVAVLVHQCIIMCTWL